jgi:integrase/recombinase XerD
MMDNIVSACMAYMKDQLNLSDNTLLSYERDIRQYIAYLRTSGIHETHLAGKPVLEKYIESLGRMGKSPSTISRSIASLRIFYRYLIRNGHVEGNPLYGITTPKIDKRPPRAVSEQEMSKLILVPGTEGTKSIRDRVIMRLLYEAGLKVSELIALNVEQVELDKSCISIAQGAKHRQIAIPAQCAEDVRDYLMRARPYLLKNSMETSLFINSSGKRFSRQGIWKIIKKYTKMAQLENGITPSVLRRSLKTLTVE